MHYNAGLFADLSYQNSIVPCRFGWAQRYFSRSRFDTSFDPWVVEPARTLRNKLKPFPDGSEMELRRCQNQNDPPKMGWFENMVLNPLADHHFFY